MLKSNRTLTVERTILIAMIVSRDVLAKLAPVYKDHHFRSPWSRQVAGWCVDHYKKHERAPGPAVETAFALWSENNDDKEAVRLVESLLSSLSGQYSQQRAETDVSHVLELAGNLFRKNDLLELSEAVRGHLEAGNLTEGLSTVSGFAPTDLAGDRVVLPLNDALALYEAFKGDTGQVVVPYDGALGQFWGKSLSKGNFVSFLAPEKAGKSFWMLDAAFRSLNAGHSVAIFEAGDLTRNDVMRRIMSRISGLPLFRKPYKVPKRMKGPGPGGGPALIQRELRKPKRGLSQTISEAALKRYLRRRPHTIKNLRLSCHPAGTLGVADIRSQLEEWRKEKWLPDLVVVDYADLLTAQFRNGDLRQNIDANWKGLRGISQQYDALVLTATQADAKSYNSATLTRSNFSDDKRKMAHVTGMVGINKSAEEYDKGLCRLNWIVRREAASTRRQVHVAGCLAMANPAMLSAW